MKRICFFKNQNFERFQKSYYLSRILLQVCYMLNKKISNTWSTNVGSFTRAHLANMGQKHELIWEKDFAFRILKMAEHEISERCEFSKFLSWKPVLNFFSKEHEMNLNKRRRQLQSPVLGVLVFLWIKFLDF